MQLESALTLALELAQQGHHVFPVAITWNPEEGKVDKSPLTRHSHLDATTDGQKINALFGAAESHLHYLVKQRKVFVSDNRPAEFGVGIRPGVGGYVVIDVDGETGAQGYNELALPATAVACTVSGSKHYWFKTSEGQTFGNAHTLPKGIDVRSDGGWVVAPGTTTCYGEWRWEAPLGRAVQVPSQLVDRLRPPSVSATEGVTEEQIDNVGREMYERMIALGGWGPRWREDPTRPCGGSIELSRPGKGWHQGCSIGGIGYNAVHFYTSAWKTGVSDPEFFEAEGNYDLGELDRYIKTGQAQPTIAKPTAVRAARSGRLRDALLDRTGIKKLSPPEYLVDQYLVRDTLAMLVAEPGVGKSFLAIDWMMHIASGRDWLGHRVKKAEPVLYLIAESPNSFGPRVSAWEQYHQLTESDELEPTVFLPIPANLSDPADIAELVEIIDEIRPGLIVVDTLARSTTGAEENSSKDMGIVINNADELRRVCGSCVLLIHHTGHTEKGRGRGSSAVYGAIYTELILSGSTESTLVLRNTKAKGAAKTDDLRYKMTKVTLDGMVDELGRPVTSLVVVDQNEAPQEEESQGKLPKDVEVALMVLSKIQVSPGMSSSQWQTAWKEYTGKYNSSGQFYAARKKCVDLGLVQNNGTDKRALYWTEYVPEGIKVYVKESDR
jgi:hypothetical protein